MAEAPDRVREKAARIARPLAFGILFALLVVLIKIAVHSIASPFRADFGYKLGVLMGFGLALVSGVVFGLPMLARQRRTGMRALSSALAAAWFAMAAISAHYHAVFNRLAGVETLGFVNNPGPLRFSMSSHWPAWLAAFEVVVPAVVLFGLAPGMANWLRRRLEDPVRRKLVMWLCALAVLTSLVTALAGRGQIRYGVLPPLVNLASTSKLPDQVSSRLDPVIRASAVPDPALVREIQQELGVEEPGPPLSHMYPYCRPDLYETEPANQRSVILLILESVGTREMMLEHAGRPLMPNLRRLADRSVLFRKFYAQGDRSSQALVAIMSGIPAPTHRRLFSHAPLVNLRGLPADLEAAGVDTIYFHGSDLGFEQQRSYLKMIGMGTLSEPTPKELRDSGGWGLPDGEVLGRLEHWVDARQPEDGPYMATLFTLTSHDPYELPAGEVPAVPGMGQFNKFASILAYMDRELGSFFEWYEKTEMPRGTVLLITGDHVPRLPHPGDRLRTNTGEFEYRFEVPLIVAGLSRDDMSAARELAGRTAGQLDIPQTVLGLMGMATSGCYQGRDLLDDTEPWPIGRKVVSMAGEQLEFFYIHEGNLRWMANTRTDTLMLHDVDADPGLMTNLLSKDDHRAQGIWRFVHDYMDLGRYLNLGNRFSPPSH